MRVGPRRVSAARKGVLPFEALTELERAYFLDLLDEDLFAPDAETQAYFKAMVDAGGAVGEDEQGRLVRSLPGGQLDTIEDK